ncbi:non-specific lipid-transfer protein C, cotyledon-specific isoform-like [Dioscorea cayenensis subsp. rotundata]|uniref:Non-specific lipid-transfer protein n=1 Tax=Dioscorea cayennensis subsp. rotundata TaxID=55577 RepID=A0AB40BU26_DIOCR|nr:non-specific lipid-transfer protein C, cotyledon-specific isoform-like [Dioscorea cayenensis subsp. rotundata]
MKNTSTTTFYLFLLLISTTLLLAPATTAVTCGIVAAKAAPCLGFVTGKVAKVPAACCSGLWQLAHSAVTVTDRRAICACLKNAVKAFPGVKEQYLSQVPKACHIPVPFPVSLNTNCNQVH